jgi:hypothetical protein
VPSASAVEVGFADIDQPLPVKLSGSELGFANMDPKPELSDQAYTLIGIVAVALYEAIPRYFALYVFPRRSFMEIVPDGIPARILTSVSLSDIVAVLDLPNSTLTSDIEIVPVGVVT